MNLREFCGDKRADYIDPLFINPEDKSLEEVNWLRGEIDSLRRVIDTTDDVLYQHMCRKMCLAYCGRLRELKPRVRLYPVVVR